MSAIKYILTGVLIAGVVLMQAPASYADETSEVILRLLIKKGIITQAEVDGIKAEVAAAKEPVPAGLEERVAKLEETTPTWAQRLKFKGDLRLRHESLFKDQAPDQHRQRMRLRYGATMKLHDTLKLGFGLASGSSDTPTSTNQTLEQEFQSKQIWIDYAYAKWSPVGWGSVIGGKFKSPFYHTDMPWDGDIRFDGIAGNVTCPVSDYLDILPDTKIHFRAGYFPIDDRAGANDVWLGIVQAADDTKIGDVAKLRAAVTYYHFDNMKGYTSSAEGPGTPTNTQAVGGPASDFRIISPYAKLTFLDPFGIDIPVAVFGEYAFNDGAASGNNDEAWRGGVELGRKVKRKNDWRLIGQFTRLEADAMYDAFPDGDLNSGGTNAQGWEAIFDYGLLKNVILSVDYYNTKTIAGAQSDEQVVETDVIFKF